ncbi:hypothetical protein ACHAWF_017277 [Thalassiosira exigua]
MQDPHLLEATASESLSMEEEVKMQMEWRDDESKCTFIILARDLIDDRKDLDVPPLPASVEVAEAKKTYPRLVEDTLPAMIGDVNLFLSEQESEGSGDELEDETPQSTPMQIQAELDLMIAVASHRHRNLGTELALMMMHYGAKHLRIQRFFVKIKEENHSSLKLFKEKIGFVECAYAKCFGEYELECKHDTPDAMLAWIQKRWEQCVQDRVDVDNCQGGRIYDIYSCPLTSSE